MNRSQRREMAQLPLSLSAWEAALVDLPVTIEGVETEGFFVVAEHGSGLVRAAGPVVEGASLWSVFGTAFTDPPPPAVPSRPARLMCTDPALVRRLERELSGLDLQVDEVESVPAVDEMLASLQSHFTAGRAPGIDVELQLWGAVLEALARMAPWQAVSDGVQFSFGGVAGLEDAIAVVLGQAGEQLGVALYPTRLDYEQFLDAAVKGDIAALEEVEALNLYLDPIEELTGDELEACEAAGLVTSGGLCPRVLVLAGGMPSPASEPAQRILLAVVQGILALMARSSYDLENAPSTCVASTCMGTIEVRSFPPERGLNVEPELIDAEFAMGVGAFRSDRDGMDRMALVIKLRKRDAQRLAARLVDVDHLRIDLVDGIHNVHALVGSHDLGLLVNLRHLSDVQRLAGAERVMLCVSAGGPKRLRISPLDFVMAHDVVVQEFTSPRRGHAPIFDEPIARWPKGSETLLRFAEPFLQDPSMGPASVLLQTLNMACTVWNAVVMADLAGDSTFLDDVQAALALQGGPQALVQALIERKRARFTGDPRILGPVTMDTEGEELQVFVETRLPPGYEVGVRKGS